RPRLDEVEHRRFPNRRLDLFAGRRCSSQGENSGPDNCADADASQRKRPEHAFKLTLRRGGFGNEMVRTFCFEQLQCHGARSSHQALCLVNLKFRLSILQSHCGSTLQPISLEWTAAARFLKVP